jgi:hypothetical protein
MWRRREESEGRLASMITEEKGKEAGICKLRSVSAVRGARSIKSDASKERGGLEDAEMSERRMERHVRDGKYAVANAMSDRSPRERLRERLWHK